ncbi:PREDICTED: uncharacterized protein LOC106806763 [Priapulus caudatus]|uniref:Uncharacterized protein LOC106806763 n=1 Tax=Priapulus caudatus TaxID=37621 RepID=A0ABM1DWI9_PRICU|nr:PREDICTED: uncharacterized protein LOC106806763 [Priapulus caudatus]
MTDRELYARYRFSQQGIDSGAFQQVIGDSFCVTKSKVCRAMGAIAAVILMHAQWIVNSDDLFLNLVARWPGSVHDSFIIQTEPTCSALEDDPRSGGIEGGLLLGNSGYALSRFLVTPYAAPANERRLQSYRPKVQ